MNHEEERELVMSHLRDLDWYDLNKYIHEVLEPTIIKRYNYIELSNADNISGYDAKLLSLYLRCRNDSQY